MYRIGLLVPSSNVTMEPDFYKMSPQGVTIHSARVTLTEFTQEALRNTLSDAQGASELLAAAKVDVIVYGCSTCALMGGLDWEQILVDQINFNTGIRAVSVNQAMIDAIRSLGGRNVGVVTPYTDSLNRLKKRYLEAHGLTVPRIKGLGLSDAYMMGVVGEDAVMPLVEQVAKDADIVLISCTSIPVIHLIEKIEAQTGLPVVTSNQAGFWGALRGSGIKALDGYGRLMQLT
jgi:maleate isomerase